MNNLPLLVIFAVIMCSCIRTKPQSPTISIDKAKLSQVTRYEDGTMMTDSKCDGVLYKNVGGKYFKRSIIGSLQAEWFVHLDSKPLETSTALRKMLSLPYENKSLNGKTYLISGDLSINAIKVARGTQLSNGNLKLDNTVVSNNRDGANILNITTDDNTFDNITFDGNQGGLKKNVPTRGVNLSGERNTFNKCTFRGATINGIRIYGKGHRFNNCIFTENAGTGI